MNDAREIPRSNATADEVGQLLRDARTVAVVGLSDKPDRDSHHVAAYLQAHGYQILPVNPNAAEILGEKSYASLRELPLPVDIVDVFRKPAAVPEIVTDAIAIGAKAVWMQDGIFHSAAAERARAAGLRVVMDKCMLREHRRLIADQVDSSA